MTDNTARLLINCPDAPGIVSAVSGFLYQHGANITDLDQHATAPIGGSYFMRLEFQTEQMTLSPEALSTAF
ncbi:MAG: formyltetrahydrofolate deformylase, partial [Acinetobacter sp.]|nr:formyltetrahydrofolate deformylase [Acinetobacter sp.]